jgi:hypothetical protein
MADLSGFQFTGVIAQTQSLRVAAQVAGEGRTMVGEEIKNTVREQAKSLPDDVCVDDVLELLGISSQTATATERLAVMEGLWGLGGSYRAYQPDVDGKRSYALRFRRKGSR